MYSHDSQHSKNIQLHKTGQWAVTSDKCTAFGGATPRCMVAAAHIKANECVRTTREIWVLVMAVVTNQPAVTMGY